MKPFSRPAIWLFLCTALFLVYCTNKGNNPSSSTDPSSQPSNKILQVKGIVTSNTLDLSLVKVGIFNDGTLASYPPHEINASGVGAHQPDLWTDLSVSNDTGTFTLDLPDTLPVLGMFTTRVLVAWVDANNDSLFDIETDSVEKNLMAYYPCAPDTLCEVWWVDYVETSTFEREWRFGVNPVDSTLSFLRFTLDSGNYDKFVFPFDK